MSLVPVVRLSQDEYEEFRGCSLTVLERWRLFSDSSPYNDFSHDLKLVILHEILFRVLDVSATAQLSYETANCIQELFERELTTLSNSTICTVPDKESAGERCIKVLSELLAAGVIDLDCCTKFQKLFADEYLAISEGLLFVLSESNDATEIQLGACVHTPAVPPPLVRMST